MPQRQIHKCDLTEIESHAFKNGLLQVLPYAFYEERSLNEVHYFMFIHGIYVLPTIELIDWLKENIIGKTIEIGAGLGAIGRSLQIPITDSHMQSRPEIALFYQKVGQPTIKYPKDVEKLCYIDAINKYKPDTIIGAFITHKYRHDLNSGNALGVVEEYLLRQVNRYIVIGNDDTHKDKPIRKLKNEEFYFEWLITRSANQKNNRVWLFKSNNKI